MKTNLLQASLLVGVLALYACGNSGKQPNTSYITGKEPSELSFQYKTMEEAEDKLMASIKKEKQEKDYYYNSDLISFVIHEPRSISYPFTKLQKDSLVSIVTSADGNLRLYSWDTGMGASVTYWDNICQYRCDGKVYAYDGNIQNVGKYYEENNQNTDDRGCSVLNISTLKSKNGTPVYLVLSETRMSDIMGYCELDAVKIEEGELRQAPIFVNGQGTSNSLTTDMIARVPAFRTKDGENWNHLFCFDAKNAHLYVPEYGDSVPETFYVYQFDGSMFLYLTHGGGPWLHPSVRSFQEKRYEMVTDNYHVRVDSLDNGNLRYASWKSGMEMSEEPEIVIEGGSFDQKHNRYVFQNEGCEYQVSTDGRLKVLRRGRTIVNERQK